METEQLIRASDSDREHAAEALRSQFAEGRLTLEEFNERTSAVYAARTWTDLRDLTSDLPVRLSFGQASQADGASAPDDWSQRWPGARRPWRFTPLLPVLLVWMVAASIGAWYHTSGHFFPFFPVIPLTIFGGVFALRWLMFRQGRR
jgi:Domain of unknown function (DUF1707)